MTIAREFEEAFGVTPNVIASAPGRVNLIGEHIDYTEGWVLPFAIGYRTQVAMSLRGDKVVELVSVQKKTKSVQVSLSGLAPDSSRGWAEYVLGVIRELGISQGLNIAVDGDVPLGAGLSSSAALECAVAAGLNELFSLGKSKPELALAAQAAENNFVGMPCGIMDQAVSMMAQEHHALLLDCKTLETEQIPLDLEKAGLALLVTDTRAHHALTDGGYASRRTSLENSCRILGIESMRHATLDMIQMHASELGTTNFKRSRHAVTEIARVHAAVKALRSSNFAELGELLNSSHNSLRDDYTVSCKELDIAVDTACALGALGSRMVGGGFGGSAIALVPVGMITAVREGIRQAFSAAGLEEPQFFVAQPNAGATASRAH